MKGAGAKIAVGALLLWAVVVCGSMVVNITQDLDSEGVQLTAGFFITCVDINTKKLFERRCGSPVCRPKTSDCHGQVCKDCYCYSASFPHGCRKIGNNVCHPESGDSAGCLPTYRTYDPTTTMSES